MSKGISGAKPSPTKQSAGKTAIGNGGELHQTADGAGATLTTNQGVSIADNQNSLKASPRGPTLLEDFILREKITHFDHERIPERIVHARGSGAHGVFELTHLLEQYTTAHILTELEKTEVFARFSTGAGGSGSADTPRAVRDASAHLKAIATDAGGQALSVTGLQRLMAKSWLRAPCQKTHG